MSIMQMVAYHTLTIVHKVIQTGKPEYITNELEVEQNMDLNWKEGPGEVLLLKYLNTTLTYREQVSFTAARICITEL